MKIMEIRRVGDSNVISLPRELESLGYVPGTMVMVEELEKGELRLVPTARRRKLTRERAEKLALENQELLEFLAEHDGPVAETATRPDASPA